MSGCPLPLSPVAPGRPERHSWTARTSNTHSMPFPPRETNGQPLLATHSRTVDGRTSKNSAISAEFMCLGLRFEGPAMLVIDQFNCLSLEDPCATAQPSLIFRAGRTRCLVDGCPDPRSDHPCDEQERRRETRDRSKVRPSLPTPRKSGGRPGAAGGEASSSDGAAFTGSAGRAFHLPHPTFGRRALALSMTLAQI